MYSKFRKYRNRKKFRFGGVKMAKSNKIGKTEELIAGYKEAECVVSVVQRQKPEADLGLLQHPRWSAL